MDFKVDKKIFFDDTKIRRLIIIVGLLLTLIMSNSVLFDNKALIELDYRVYDVITNLLEDTPPSDKIVIIDIDDKSLAHMGQWPWARYRIAQLFKRITESGASVAGIDILFSEKDRTSLTTIKENFKNEFGLEIGFSNVPESMTDNDEYMAYIINKGNFVLSNFFHFDSSMKEGTCFYEPARIFGETGLEGFYRAKGAICSLPLFTKAAAGTGFFNAMPDIDGIMRRVPLVINYEGSSFLSLGLSIFQAYSNEVKYSIEHGRFSRTIYANSLAIPIDRNGSVLLNFKNKSNGYRHFSASDIIKGDFLPESLHDKIVIIGSSATGHNDHHSTSFNPYFPGIEVHATFIDNLMN